MKNNNLAIIPIRGGSKRIKDKNIKNFNGYPLFYYTVTSALKSKIFNKIIISSDEERYLNIAFKLFKNKKNIFNLVRPKIFSKNSSTSESVIDHAIKKYKNFDNICLIQATSPLLGFDDLVSAYKVFINENYDSLFSCYSQSKFQWKINNRNIKPLNYDFKNRPMSQKFKSNIVIENGAFYFFKCKKYYKYQNRLFGKIGCYIMDNYSSIDIDNKKDFRLAEYIHSKKNFFLNN